MKWGVGILSILMILMIFGGMSIAHNVSPVTRSAYVNFSPEEVWSVDVNKNRGTINGTYSAMDSNGDDKAEIMVEVENYSASTFTAVLLNGSDGNLLNLSTFTDVGYSENGDMVGMDGTLFGITIADATGTPYVEHYFMVFGNHSNNKHISIYSVEYPSLKNLSYKGIDIPSQITYGGYSISVKSYDWIFHIDQVNHEPCLVYFGIYEGSAYGYIVYQLEIKVFDKNLNTVWSRTEKVIGQIMVPIGVDMVEFNSHGFSSSHSDIILFNLTKSPGNTTIVALNLEDGSELWESTVYGYYIISDPIGALFSGSTPTYLFDYNADNSAEIMITTKTTNNETHLNFIDSSGSILGYYNTSIRNYTIMSIYTDVKTGIAHQLIRAIDVNNDGYGEVFFVENNSKALCWDVKNNQTIWEKDLGNQSYYYSLYLSTNDFTGDGVWDIYLIGMNDTTSRGYRSEKINITMVNSATGTMLTSLYYDSLVSAFSGTVVQKEISDINGDGAQDSILVQGYFNDGSSLYVHVWALSMNGSFSFIWDTDVDTGVNSEDYRNWTAYAFIVGDMDGDGYPEVLVKLYYTDAGGNVSTYLRILSGKDGSVIWTGEVLSDKRDTDLEPFAPLAISGGWTQFDYNDDSIINEMLITTTSTVHIYAVSQPIPEFSTMLILIAIPVAMILLRKKS